MEYRVGDRIIIVKAEGKTIGELNIPLKDPHPELIDCEGTIVSIDEDDAMPRIRLDSGIELEGCECWWQKKEGEG